MTIWWTDIGFEINSKTNGHAFSVTSLYVYWREKYHICTMTIIYKSPSLKDLFRVHFILKRIHPIRNTWRKRLIIITQFTPQFKLSHTPFEMCIFSILEIDGISTNIPYRNDLSIEWQIITKRIRTECDKEK